MSCNCQLPSKFVKFLFLNIVANCFLNSILATHISFKKSSSYFYIFSIEVTSVVCFEIISYDAFLTVQICDDIRNILSTWEGEKNMIFQETNASKSWVVNSFLFKPTSSFSWKSLISIGKIFNEII